MPTFRQSVSHPLAIRTLTVRDVSRRSPSVVRVVAGGDDLTGFKTLSPTDHVKLLVPGPDGVLPPVPDVVSGRVRFGPDGPPPLRDYTVRHHDAQAQTVTFDIAIHGRGRVSSWAVSAQPGDTVAIAGPRGSHLTPLADTYVLIGDLTSLPAIARWAEELSAEHTVSILVAIDDPDDAIDIASDADVTVRWVHDQGTTIAADLLAGALEHLPIPTGDRFVWAGGEVIAMRGVRDLLKARGIAPDESEVEGYWRRGRANHDHHAPLDAD